MLFNTAYSEQRKELTEAYRLKQQTANTSTERKAIFREYLSESLKLAIENGEAEDIAHFQESLELAAKIERNSMEIELHMKEVEREYRKLIIIQEQRFIH